MQCHCLLCSPALARGHSPPALPAPRDTDGFLPRGGKRKAEDEDEGKGITHDDVYCLDLKTHQVGLVLMYVNVNICVVALYVLCYVASLDAWVLGL